MTSIPEFGDKEDVSTVHKKHRTASEFIKKYFMAGQKTHEDSITLTGPPSQFEQFMDNYKKPIALIVPLTAVHIVYWLLAFEYDFFKYFETRYEIVFLMMFAATIGGATAEGGGAIAFPVLTLAFNVPTKAARDFSVMIQSVGMNSASMSMHIMGILLEKRALFSCAIGGAIGTVVSLEFLDGLLSGSVKKIAFVSIFFSFAVALFMLNKEKKRKTFDQIQNFDWENAVILIVTGFVGGLFSGIAGSGLEVFVFSILSLLFRINEKVVAPTTVALAGINSAVAFFWRHYMQHAIAPIAWEYLAVGVPVSTFFAPLGSAVASHFHRQTLAVVIYAIETIALISAFIIIRPSLPICGMSVVIIVTALSFYVCIGRIGERRYTALNRRDILRRRSSASVCTTEKMISVRSADIRAQLKVNV